MNGRFSRLSDRVFVASNTALLTLFSLLCLYPVVHIIAVSMSGAGPIMKNEVGVLPKELTVAAYRLVFQNPSIWQAYGNTVLYTAVGTLFNLILITMAAYPLSKRRLIGRGPVSFYFILTTLISGGMIPTYLVVRQLGFIDTIWAIVVPGAMSVFYMIVLRTHFEGVPKELEEAAVVDGLGNAGVLLRIYLPLSVPIYAAYVLFFAVEHWNSFFSALIYLNSKDKYPLQVLLREIVISNTMSDLGGSLGGRALQDRAVVSENIKAATIVIVMLPIMLVYPFIQKYFIKGMMMGAIKG